MSIAKILLVIGVVLTVVKLSFGPHHWLFVVEVFARLLVVAWMSAAGG